MTYPHVPYVPTPEHVVRKMLELAGAGPNDIVYDLGAGDGRIVIIAVREFNVKKAIGIEIRSDLVREPRTIIKELNIKRRT